MDTTTQSAEENANRLVTPQDTEWARVFLMDQAAVGEKYVTAPDAIASLVANIRWAERRRCKMAVRREFNGVIQINDPSAMMRNILASIGAVDDNTNEV